MAVKISNVTWVIRSTSKGAARWLAKDGETFTNDPLQVLKFETYKAAHQFQRTVKAPTVLSDYPA